LASDTRNAESKAKAKITAEPSESAVRTARAKQKAERERREKVLSPLSVGPCVGACVRVGQERAEGGFPKYKQKVRATRFLSAH